MKKKFLAIFVSVVLCVTGLTGCGGNGKKTTYTFYVPDGAPLLSVASIAKTAVKIDGNVVKTEIVKGTEIAGKLTNSVPDMAIAPVNVCASMFNNGGKYIFAGVSVWGLLHIITKDPLVNSLDDLIGETLYAFQKAGTPGLSLIGSLEMSGVPYKELTDGDSAVDGGKVNICFLDGTDKVKLIMTEGLEGIKGKHGVLAEPAVTALIASTANAADGEARLYRGVDIQSVWTEETGDTFPQAGLLIKKSILENDKAFADAFLAKIAEASVYTRENAESAAKIVKDELESGDLPNKAVTKLFIESAVGQAALKYSQALECKTIVANYFEKLASYGGGMTILGGSIPSGDFFYNAAAVY